MNQTLKITLFICFIFSFLYLHGIQASQLVVQSDSIYKYNIILTGASFASTDNKWFEMGCRYLNAKAINRAKGGEAIADTANRMIEGTLYTHEEFEDMDALVIMQVHDRDVFDESQLLSHYKNYQPPFTREKYAAAYDYVIKRYISECYELKNNPDSKYYGTQAGKPAIIVLCTHWHDARVTYNTSIRKLANKWGLPLVELDKYIGFSKDSVHPITNEQYSLLYSTDSQIIAGVKYGFHPIRGEKSYVQQRMATIFINLMNNVLPVK